MAINVVIPDDTFNAKEIKILKKTFRCSNDTEFHKAIQKITLASLKEYKEMLIGRGLPTRADDIRQYRLFLLINEYFENNIPTESEVAALFQITPSQSRSLIRTVMTRYKYKLQDQIDETLKNTILNSKNPKKDINSDNKCKLYIPSDNIVEQLNRIIDELSTTNQDMCRLRKSNEGTRLYWTYKNTYEKLIKQLKITNFDWNNDLKS